MKRSACKANLPANRLNFSQNDFIRAKMRRINENKAGSGNLTTHHIPMHYKLYETKPIFVKKQQILAILRLFLFQHR